MTEERRLEMIRDIKEKADKNKLNIMTLYCLIATMTDEKLDEFYNEFLNIK